MSVDIANSHVVKQSLGDEVQHFPVFRNIRKR